MMLQLSMMDFLAAHADELHVEAIFDYYPGPFGRGWKCDRGGWQVYNKELSVVHLAAIGSMSR
jgi:hypothetical protein